MPPPTLLAAAQLRQMIYYHLDNGSGENAIFLASRLHALDVRNPDAIYLLGLCHHRLGQYREAAETCKVAAMRGAHLGCSYIFAQACLEMEKFQEGINNLERVKGLWTDKNYSIRETRRSRLPDTAAVLSLLGQLHEKNADPKHAVECYADSLKLNPFMWTSFERLCSLGAHIRPENVFKSNPDITDMLCQHMDRTYLDEEHNGRATQHTQMRSASHAALTSQDNDPFASRDAGMSLGGSNRVNIAASQDTHSPLTADIISDAQIAPISNAAIRRPRTGPTAPSTIQSSLGNLNLSWDRSRTRQTQEDELEHSDVKKGPSSFLAASLQVKRTISGTTMTQPPASAPQDDNLLPQQRRSTRLFKSTTKLAPAKEVIDPKKPKASTIRGRTANTATVGRVVSGNRKAADPSDRMMKDQRAISAANSMPTHLEKPPVNPFAKSAETTEHILDLLSRIGRGYYLISNYRCEDALQAFAKLPTPQRESPWVLAQCARAYYEMGNYTESEAIFKKIQKLAPSRLEDMEIYSTVLWHLRNEIELGFLAQELMSVSRLSPQSWCAVGNAFSLQRDHDQALKCFRRASQLDNRFAYALTLQGHEHCANEEFDKALTAYRQAVAADSRHYNGWYGIAKVLEKQGKYGEASEHYNKAASINPHNAILICCKGWMLERLKNPQLALREYESACKINPKSSLARYRKAHMLYNLGNLDDALKELLVLKDLVPDESRVHFLLAKTFKKLRIRESALQHFTIAMNLDPKAMQQIKEEMETFDEPDGYQDDDDDDDDMIG